MAALSSHGTVAGEAGEGDAVSGDLLHGLVLRVARADERQDVLAFRSAIYRQELGDAGVDRFDESAHHLVACDPAGRFVAALRIVGPDDRPLPLEALIDLSDILGGDRRPAEVARFCIAKDHRQIHRGQMLHLGMLKLVHEFAIKHHLTDLFTLGLPHLKNLYRIGFFAATGVTCVHPLFGQAELMHLDMAEVRRQYEDSPNRMARLLFKTRVPNIVL